MREDIDGAKGWAEEAGPIPQRFVETSDRSMVDKLGTWSKADLDLDCPRLLLLLDLGLLSSAILRQWTAPDCA